MNLRSTWPGVAGPRRQSGNVMKRKLRVLVLFLVMATMSGAPAVAEEQANCVPAIVPFYLCDTKGNCIQIGWTVECQGRGASGSW
jgi:hypothetical protein